MLFKINNLTDLEKLAKQLLPYLKPNTFLLLQGELGVGKTSLTQLLAKNLGITEKITSPTFTILQRHQIKEDYYLNHFDFFRLNPNDDLRVFQELTVDNLNIIEWPEKNPQFWEKSKYLKLEMSKQKKEMRLVSLFFSYEVV